LIEGNIIYYIFLELCLGIKENHKNNLIHRNLKPENIFINKDNKIKIGVFGISKQLKMNENYAYTRVGSQCYIAPEVIKGEKYNNKIDIWALGCIIYELFTFNICFESSSLNGLINKIIEGTHDKIDMTKYNSKWQNLIDLLLKKDYNERPNIDEVYNYFNNNIKNEIILKIDNDDNNKSYKKLQKISNEEYYKLRNEGAKDYLIRSKIFIFLNYFFIISIVIRLFLYWR